MYGKQIHEICQSNEKKKVVLFFIHFDWKYNYLKLARAQKHGCNVYRGAALMDISHETGSLALVVVWNMKLATNYLVG